MPRIFISYRRSTDRAFALDFANVLKLSLDPSAVFIDESSIPPGTVFPDAIRDAMQAASILLVIIGPKWLRAADGAGRRLMDREQDWVRQELELGLARDVDDLHILPVLVNNAAMPKPEDLPPSISALANRQAFEIDITKQASKGQLVDILTERLAEFQQETWLPWPEIVKEKPVHLTDGELSALVNGDLLMWAIETSRIPEDPRVAKSPGTLLVRGFEFISFRQAVAFMHSLVPIVDALNHHPRWENVWRTVIVRLSTWDNGHRVSERDAMLARIIDKAYLPYAAELKRERAADST